MEAIGQPNIHVDGQTASADGSDRFLANGDRVRPERLPEAGIEPHAILPKRWLIIVDDTGERYGVLHERPVMAGLGSIFPIREKGQAARGNPARLLGHELVGLATGCEVHAAHPRFHGPPKFNLGCVRADRLCLQIQQDQARDRAVRHAHQLADPVPA